ncbi:putative PhzF superfamily epimerase YddE/YHI9 [Streptacidiphilus sp. MAP12-20]|uniref:PhzF family phenazine biosynthesis protein n=1 Tax=Streptacidiphilus sp. MAP12-20 TaxID=3156299 RepID=UPI0035175648
MAAAVDRPTRQLGAAPSGLAEALGTDGWKDVWTTGALGDLVVELADEADVRALTPDHTRLAALDADIPRGVIVTARAAAPDASGYDFVSRWFGTGVVVGEDPVTGSAHTALAPLWAERLGVTELTGRQVSARGGTVQVRLVGDRVLLSGRAVTVWDGTLAAAATP